MRFETASELDFSFTGFPAAFGWKASIDNELAHIPACDSERLWYLELQAAVVNMGHMAALYAVYTDDSELLAFAYDMEFSGDEGLHMAARKCCFNAATRVFFHRLDWREMNCEDAVNRLAYDSLSLYTNTSVWDHNLDTESLDYFLGLAREYVRKNGPDYGIEWFEY